MKKHKREKIQKIMVYIVLAAFILSLVPTMLIR